jgi:cold shock CspA family protein
MKKRGEDYKEIVDSIDRIGIGIHKGVVKWYSPLLGYGFIKDRINGEDFFVHASGLKDHSVKDRDPVIFQVAQHKGKTIAVDVEKLEDSEL